MPLCGNNRAPVAGRRIAGLEATTRSLVRAVPVMGWRIAGLMATTCSVTYSASHYRLLGYGGMLPRLLSP